jgi:hypothetical protein
MFTNEKKICESFIYQYFKSEYVHEEVIITET